MSDLYGYIAAFFTHWWPLVTAGSLFGIEEFAERYLTWLHAKLERVPSHYRKRAVSAALIASVFYSGFLAWQDEHAKVAAVQQLPSAISKLVISGLQPDSVKGDIHFFKLSVENRGSLDAEYPDIYLTGLPTQLSLSPNQEDTLVDPIITSAKHLKYRLKGNQIIAGRINWITIRAAFTPLEWDKVRNGQARFGIFLLLKYVDSTTPSGFARYTEFCGYFDKDNTTSWNFCNAHNRVDTLPD